MLNYQASLKMPSRELRNTMTESERVLWQRLRSRQVQGVQFYRQKPIGRFIVDFYAPSAKLVIEVDGSQHYEEDGLQRDKERNAYLSAFGLRVLRFNNRQVLMEIDAVMDVIDRAVVKSPPAPLFQSGEFRRTSINPPFEKGGRGDFQL